MKVIRCRGTTFWSVVEDCPAGTKINHELKKGIDIFSDGLEAMVKMGDREVRRENRHGIAEDQVFVSVEDPFLTLREMVQAEETAPFICILFRNIGETALNSSRIVLEADGKSAAG